MFSIQEIISITQAEAVRLDKPNAEVHLLLTDSRKLTAPLKTLFFAIKGERHNGHHFIHELIQKGIEHFIMEDADWYFQNQDFLKENTAHFNLLMVRHTIGALQQIAQKHREKFNFPVIGITGSNGKTIVKEWLAQLLEPDFRVVKSPKSFNSQIGVPLSVWQIDNGYELGIFEAGISKPYEMENLAKIIQPTIGIFTNIGTAHQEGFESEAQKINEKLLLFQNCPTIYSLHSEYLSNDSFRLQQNFKLIKNITNKPTASTQLTIRVEKQDFELNLPFLDNASLENALSCLCILLHFHIPISEIQERFQHLRPISMRLEMKKGVRDCYLIDDSYSNDFAGLQLALEFMKMNRQKDNTTVILSDISEVQPSIERDTYHKIAEIIQNLSIQSLIGIGEKMCLYAPYFRSIPSLESHFFHQTQDFLQHPLAQSLKDRMILIKGGRRFAFEKIVKQFQQKTHGTVLEINLSALVHNLNFYRSLLARRVKIMVMVKAFGYGSGSAEIAQLLQYHKVDYLAVAYSDEGVFLRQNGITLPIMVLNPNPDTFGHLLAYDLEPEIYSSKILEEYFNYCQQIGKKDFKIHLKIDTGMKRLGFEPNKIEHLTDYLEEHLPWQAQVVSIFSHLAGADEKAHLEFSLGQIAVFQSVCEKIEEKLGYNTLKHILNSPGIAQFPEAQFDMVRLGVGLYGVEATQQLQERLQTVTTLKTTISQIKHIEKNQSVGYGRSFVATRQMKIATIAIGYADGFRRSLSNGIGEVGINGALCKVVGRVCMDMTMVDISQVEASEGDEVFIFGGNPTIFDFAEKLGTIPYEVLTSISERVKRVYFVE